MNYNQAAATAYQNQTQANAINQEPPKTLNSAITKIDNANDRLGKLHDGLCMIASQIGALTPVRPCEADDPAVPSGAVHRLNNGADAVHQYLSDIEVVMNAIQRSLG